MHTDTIFYPLFSFLARHGRENLHPRITHRWSSTSMPRPSLRRRLGFSGFANCGAPAHPAMSHRVEVWCIGWL
jgi:hypothetical protein